MEPFEKELVQKLREKVSDVITPEFTDFDLLRWLKEHDYNFDYIVPNLRHHFRFIKCCDFSQYADYFAIMDKYWPFGLLGLSGKDDNFVYIETLGTLDGEGITKTVPRTAVILHRFYKSEKIVSKAIRNCESEIGRQVGLVAIGDVYGSEISAKTISMLNGPYRHLAAFLLRHYKDTVRKMIIVNMNPILHFLWGIVRVVFTRRMRENLVVLGTHNYKTEILQHINADALPVHWGGNLVDENNDPKCGSKVVVCSPVPKSLYWRPCAEDSKESKAFSSLTVHARSFEYLTFKVDSANKFLEWSYYTDRDWGFGIFFTQDEHETDTEKMEMVFPQIEYLYGHTVVIEKGRIQCRKAGYYKVWFNNTFSWLTKLKVRHKVRIVDN